MGMVDLAAQVSKTIEKKKVICVESKVSYNTIKRNRTLSDFDVFSEDE